MEEMVSMRKKKIYIDFDGVISDTIATICSLYNDDFQEYPDYEYINWFDVNSWDFTELKLADKEYINSYFNQPRFFDRIILMDHVIHALKSISKKYDIVVVSMGNSPNLELKSFWLRWFEDNYDIKIGFIGCEFAKHNDKSSIDMSGCVFIDDLSNNLRNSNADIKICFGDEYPWNTDWNGIRCYNWMEVLRKLNLEL